MRRATLILAIGLVSAVLTPAECAPLVPALVPADKNLTALALGLTFDQFTLGVLNRTVGTSGFDATGVIRSDGWTASISGTAAGRPMALSYSGTFDQMSDLVSWSGVGSFGAKSWTSTGEISFAPDETAHWTQTSVIGNPGEGDLGGFTLTIGLEIDTSTGRTRFRYSGDNIVNWIFTDPPNLPPVIAPMHIEDDWDPLPPLPPLPPFDPKDPLGLGLQQESLLPAIINGFDPTLIRATARGGLNLSSPQSLDLSMHVITEVTTVPEPSSVILCATGIIFLLRSRARRQ